MRLRQCTWRAQRLTVTLASRRGEAEKREFAEARRGSGLRFRGGGRGQAFDSAFFVKSKV